jgi:hypothetical protein
MPVKFWQTIVRFWFFLSYLITTVSIVKNQLRKNLRKKIDVSMFCKNFDKRNMDQNWFFVYQILLLTHTLDKPTIKYRNFNLQQVILKFLVCHPLICWSLNIEYYVICIFSFHCTKLREHIFCCNKNKLERDLDL